MDKWTAPTPAEAEEIRRAEQIVEAARREEEERRRAVRLGLHANVTAESETNFFTGFTENISEGGVFIATYSPPLEGEIVMLRLTVNGEGEVLVEGEVRWIRTDEDGQATGCGVRFRDLDDRARGAIAALLGRAEREPLLFES